MQNNHLELVGNICGNIRVLRSGNADAKVLEKIEAVIIPNDIWDNRGKPNSFRVHIYGDKAVSFKNDCKNGSKVALSCHLRRITIPKRNEKGEILTDEAPSYNIEIIVEDYKVLRKESTGYFSNKKMAVESLESVPTSVD